MYDVGNSVTDHYFINDCHNGSSDDAEKSDEKMMIEICSELEANSINTNSEMNTVIPQEGKYESATHVSCVIVTLHARENLMH